MQDKSSMRLNKPSGTIVSRIDEHQDITSRALRSGITNPGDVTLCLSYNGSIETTGGSGCRI